MWWACLLQLLCFTGPVILVHKWCSILQHLTPEQFYTLPTRIYETTSVGDRQIVSRKINSLCRGLCQGHSFSCKKTRILYTEILICIIIFKHISTMLWILPYGHMFQAVVALGDSQLHGLKRIRTNISICYIGINFKF